MRRMVARPENRHQARLLRLLRDEGPRSRAELTDAVELSKSKVADELDRLTTAGLVEAGGLAASRGGRRSPIVQIARQLHFVGIGSDQSPFLAQRLADAGSLTAFDVADAAAAGDPVAVATVRDGGRRVGKVLAGLVSILNPGLIVIGGGVSRVGHALLAEIRGVVYRQSLPLATGNLPIVLSELGDEAGVTGAARMISDHVFQAR